MPLPPGLMVQALHDVLLDLGVPPGFTFEGDDWDDVMIVGLDIHDRNAISNYTRAGRSYRLWSLENDQVGAGRGNRRRVTLLA